MRHTRSSFATPLFLLAACTADPSPPEAEVSDASVSTDAPDAAPLPDAAPGADAGDAAPDAGDAASAPRACALADAGAPSSTLAMRWSADPVAGATGAPAAHGETTADGCTVALESVPLGGMPPRWAVVLEKRDASPGSCASPKGRRILWSPTYAAPKALLAHHPVERRLFVVAFDHKNTPSGSSPTNLDVQQVDFETGDVLHAAAKYVRGTPPVLPPPAASPTSLTVDGCDLALEGTGTFAGASGTKTGAFEARWVGFVAPSPQEPSPADSASYR